MTNNVIEGNFPLIRGGINQVRNFHKAAGLKVADKPALDSHAGRSLRVALLAEEMNEYLTAEDEDDIVRIADGLGDIIYVAMGTALSYGIPLEAVFQEICRSNNTKVVDGKVVRREDGKILKPDTYTPPDIKKIIDGAS